MPKTIVITGASTGIGFATAEALVKDGYHVLATARKDQDLENLKNVGAQPVKVDLCSTDQIAALKPLLEQHQPWALINNAGIAVYGPLERVPMKVFRQQFEVNIFGLVELTQMCLPYLRRQKGRIVNVSSISGRIATGFMSPYSSSKFALEAITDALRRELKHAGVKVVSVNPGPIKTPIWEKRFDGLESFEQVLPDEELNQAYGSGLKQFMGRVAQAQSEAVSVDEVVKPIKQALTLDKPKTRYYVGPGIGVAALLSKFFSDKMLDKLAEKRV